MRTVEVVKTWRGWHVTRKYCGRTVASQFFSTIVPPEKKKKSDIAEFLETVETNKNTYVSNWLDN